MRASTLAGTPISGACESFRHARRRSARPSWNSSRSSTSSRRQPDWYSAAVLGICRARNASGRLSRLAASRSAAGSGSAMNPAYRAAASRHSRRISGMPMPSVRAYFISTPPPSESSKSSGAKNWMSGWENSQPPCLYFGLPDRTTTLPSSCCRRRCWYWYRSRNQTPRANPPPQSNSAVVSTSPRAVDRESTSRIVPLSVARSPSSSFSMSVRLVRSMMSRGRCRSTSSTVRSSSLASFLATAGPTPESTVTGSSGQSGSASAASAGTVSTLTAVGCSIGGGSVSGITGKHTPAGVRVLPGDVPQCRERPRLDCRHAVRAR